MIFSIVFLLIFAVTAFTMALVFSRIESQRGKRIRKRLAISPSAAQDATTLNLVRHSDDLDFVSRLLERFNLLSALEARIAQAGMAWTASGFAARSALFAAAGALIGRVLHPGDAPLISATVLGSLGAFIPWFWVSRKRSKRLSQFEAQFPEALDFLSRSIRAGHGFSISLDLLASDAPEPLASVMKRTANELKLGSPLSVALGHIAEEVPVVDTRFFVAAVLLQQTTGGNLTEILTQLSYLIRERFRLKGEIRALSAHGRMTSGVLMAMPIAITMVLLVMNPEYLTGFAHQAIGRWLLVAAATGQCVGFFVIRRMVNFKA